MYTKTTLKNGLRVITENIPGVKSVTALVLARAGSRFEEKNINGISHFLEHLFFKGAKKYKTAKDVSGAIDSVGGDFNAFTAKEYAGYYVKVGSQNKELALDVLSDMLVSARFDQEEIEKERGVILEELNMYQDTPMVQVSWDFERALFGDQPIGWDEGGEKDVIKRLGHDDFVSYKESLYTSQDMVVCLAGDILHGDAEKLVEKYFPIEDKTATRKMEAFLPALPTCTRVKLQTKKTEQAHMVCGVLGLPDEHADHYALKVMTSILGGNMSSRMFLAVRESKGLAYYISSGTEDYLDTGAFYTRAGVDVNRIDMAVTAILDEYKKIASGSADGVSEEELKKGKEFLKGKLTLSLEDSEHVAQMHARDELLYGKVRTYEDIAAEIDKVTTGDVTRVAQALLKNDALCLAVIGPYEEKERFTRALKI
ncbi:MAG: pitrilysin family protein [Candidatus Gracilibacteria bacterium]|jgi:predicted Zn-dependent peptidase